jgi:hypothetical protein
MEHFVWPVAFLASRANTQIWDLHRNIIDAKEWRGLQVHNTWGISPVCGFDGG